MLSDEQLRELFSAYIDGDVSEQVREQIELRCDEEEELRAELEDLRELVGGSQVFLRSPRRKALLPECCPRSRTWISRRNTRVAPLQLRRTIRPWSLCQFLCG